MGSERVGREVGMVVVLWCRSCITVLYFGGVNVLFNVYGEALELY